MTKQWHGGKGSSYRLTDSDAYAKNWTRIFDSGKEWPDFPLPDNPDPKPVDPKGEE